MSEVQHVEEVTVNHDDLMQIMELASVGGQITGADPRPLFRIARSLAVAENDTEGLAYLDQALADMDVQAAAIEAEMEAQLTALGEGDFVGLDALLADDDEG